MDPVTGDLVTIEPLFEKHGRGIPMFSTWGNKTGGFDAEIGTFTRQDLGLVIEDTSIRNGNGVKVLLSDGRIGWVNVNCVRKAWVE